VTSASPTVEPTTTPDLERHRRALWGLCYGMTGSAADAEDLVQETFVRALERPPPDGSRALGPWLVTVAANLARDALRRRKETPRERTSEPRFDGEVSAEARVALRELDAMLADLPPAERAALVLVSVEGLSAKEAAHALDCSEGAIEQRLVRARSALRARRDDEAGHGS